MTKHGMMFLSVIILLSLTANTSPVNCSIALIESPPFMELAEQADLILIGKVSDIHIREKDTISTFQVSEYIKQKKTSPVFNLKLAGGKSLVTNPSSPSFQQDEEYILFLMEEDSLNLMNGDVSYYLLFDDYSKLKFENVDSVLLDGIREMYGSKVVRVLSDREYLVIIFSPVLVSLLILLYLRGKYPHYYL